MQDDSSIFSFPKQWKLYILICRQPVLAQDVPSTSNSRETRSTKRAAIKSTPSESSSVKAMKKCEAATMDLDDLLDGLWRLWFEAITSVPSTFTCLYWFLILWYLFAEPLKQGTKSLSFWWLLLAWCFVAAFWIFLGIVTNINYQRQNNIFKVFLEKWFFYAWWNVLD